MLQSCASLWQGLSTPAQQCLGGGYLAQRLCFCATGAEFCQYGVSICGIQSFSCLLFHGASCPKLQCGPGWAADKLVFSSIIQDVKLLCGVSRTRSNVRRHSRGIENNYPLIHETGFGNLVIFVLSVSSQKNCVSEVLASALLWRNGTAVHI